MKRWSMVETLLISVGLAATGIGHMYTSRALTQLRDKVASLERSYIWDENETRDIGRIAVNTKYQLVDLRRSLDSFNRQMRRQGMPVLSVPLSMRNAPE